MTGIDWAIVVGFVVFLVVTMLLVGRLNKSVADFVAANRCAGRYLICVAEGAAALGIMSFLGQFEQYYEGGFCPAFWWFLVTPMYLVITMSGWIIYRFRSTRAFTYAQFYEMRYSRNFRIFTGIVGFVALLVLYGICPAIAARFLISFGGLPESWTLGAMQIPMFQTLLVIVLIIPIFITMAGGQIAVMVTDFIQGQVVQFTMIIVTLYLYFFVDWNHVLTTVAAGSETGSMINPFQSGGTSDFGLTYFLMWMLIASYTFGMAPTTSSYQASALNPHEAQMSRVWSILRNLITVTLAFFIPLAVFTMLRHPDYADISAAVAGKLDAAPTDMIRSQIRIPVVLNQVLPTGLKALFLLCAMCTAVTTDSTFMQGLGTLMTQDIILPIRGKHFKPRTHMIVLRCSMIGVAVVVYFFSLYFPQTDFLMMYLIAALGIYTAGIGIVTIGGLYWKRGSTIAAWVAMITGMVISTTLLIMRSLNADFPLNGMHSTCIALVLASVVYIVLSLIYPADCDLDKLLHREPKKDKMNMKTFCDLFIEKFILLPNNFETAVDKFVGICVRVLTWGMLFVFFTTTIWYYSVGLPDGFWLIFWKGYLIFVTGSAAIVTIWLFFGGISDFKKLVVRLSTISRDDEDDGFVEHDDG
jgi:solute:Na+ symporter, SSS family